ncbi:hypothetical protein HPP92_015574 [Vanilla planifolia]|uniref:Uncharacterized protein n=1 Tax=Vanilla planifolia TaxID=51239 RepID=A0A835QGI4_VANPL|nr:hypothetical protein HPP92_015574 [Vanilla planifolia]
MDLGSEPVVVRTAPAPSPKSPPNYPDLCGRRRLQHEVQILNREIGFLERMSLNCYYVSTKFHLLNRFHGIAGVNKKNYSHWKDFNLSPYAAKTIFVNNANDLNTLRGSISEREEERVWRQETAKVMALLEMLKISSSFAFLAALLLLAMSKEDAQQLLLFARALLLLSSYRKPFLPVAPVPL